MEYQLELIDVAKKYKDFLAVDGVSLQIRKGEIVSFLGASGCGKTTTLRMIAGLIEPTRGTIRIAGKDMDRVPPYKRDISMVFQNYALFPHMTVYENIIYGLKMRKVRDKKVLTDKAREMMEIVQLDGVENRLPRELSGGQQQRVSLARAMIVEPKVMLFDEPLSNLDAKLREKTRVEIRELLKKMNVTAIYVTHDQEEALTISDRIAVMNKGKIEQITKPEKLYTAPATRFIANFVGHANFFEGKVTSFEDGKLVMLTESGKLMSANIAATEDLKPGDPATLIIRPENVRVAGAGPEEKNTFEGTVVARIYLGSTVRYIVNLGEKKDIEVDLHANDVIDSAAGSKLRLVIGEADLVLVAGGLTTE
ncbi:MAG TPA: ABC transporter ATP-binding protein [Clostridia bacterium]|nr:ABC transporter ATP-binding protein [Clostridia bacterium]